MFVLTKLRRFINSFKQVIVLADPNYNLTSGVANLQNPSRSPTEGKELQATGNEPGRFLGEKLFSGQPQMTSPQANGTKPTAAHTPSTGLVLVDASLRPIYANAEAVKIFAYPESPRKTRLVEGLLVEKIRAIIRKQQRDPESSFHTELSSGRRRYHCRVYSLASPSNKGSGSATALVLERTPETIDLLQMTGEFNLTPRERETVELLALGLTSKEIANRMRISPNTVKAFLRLVMIKTGVSTRSGIIGKMLKGQS